jgi:hypothetical protein
LVLSGFQTVSKSAGLKNLQTLDARVAALVKSSEEPKLISVEDAMALLELSYANLEFSDESSDDDRQAHLVALEHLSRTSGNPKLKGKVWLIAAKDRNVARYREEGRFSNAPDTKQQKDLARANADDIPVLMLLRQNGDEAKGWRGLAFWWPVILTSRSAPTVIFATDEAVSPITPVQDPRALSSEELA